MKARRRRKFSALNGLGDGATRVAIKIAAIARLEIFAWDGRTARQARSDITVEATKSARRSRGRLPKVWRVQNRRAEIRRRSRP